MTQAHAASSELVGPYRVIRAIGAGGSARVDLAMIERAYGFQRQVVLKRPLEHLRGDPHVAETLRREAHLGGRLRHPNLVAVLDAGTHDGYVYLALEYVEGSALRAIMQADAGPRVRAVPLAAALSIVVGTARGLHEAHELVGADGAPLGLVHRDVSPANILIDRDGAVKLSDFGIAKDTRVSTLSGSMRGTVTYMAPEQCRGHAFDRRADVFSLGVILHELITARRLFWAENDVASLHKVLSAPLPDPREVNPVLDPELCAIAMRAIAREPAQRLPSAAELADRIEAYAARAGLVLGARAVADLVATPAGRSPNAYITIPLALPVDDEPSLVRAIEGAGEDAGEPSFGPNAAGDDEIATPVRRPSFAEHTLADPIRRRPQRRSRWLLGVVAAGAVGGIAIGAWFATRESVGDGPAPAAIAPAQIDAAPVIDPAIDASVANSTPSDAAIVEADAPAQVTDDVTDDEIEMPPDPAATKTDGHRKRPRDKRDTLGRAATIVDAGAPPAAPADAGVPPKVEWNPKLVFPGDPAK